MIYVYLYIDMQRHESTYKITDFRFQHKCENKLKSVQNEVIFEKIKATKRESYNARPHFGDNMGTINKNLLWIPTLGTLGAKSCVV
jgi:hypothetical protein